MIWGLHLKQTDLTDYIRLVLLGFAPFLLAISVFATNLPEMGKEKWKKRERVKPKISSCSNVKNAGKSLVMSCPCTFV